MWVEITVRINSLVPSFTPGKQPGNLLRSSLEIASGIRISGADKHRGQLSGLPQVVPAVSLACSAVCTQDSVHQVCNKERELSWFLE